MQGLSSGGKTFVMNLIFTQALVLWLLPLALLPFLSSPRPVQRYSSLARLPSDPLSSVLDILLRLLAAAAIAAIILGLAGIGRSAYSVKRIGQGAQIVVLLDRSSSMNRMFADRTNSTNFADLRGESKDHAARRLLAKFAARRSQDLFGMVIFSTMPIQVLPLTDKQEAIQAAIEAGAIGRGLAKTDLGAGLIAALHFFDDLPYTGSRIVILVSDGAASLDPVTRLQIESLMRRNRSALYWLYLRTRNSPGLTPEPNITTPEVIPEQRLDQFFRSLQLPYRAYPVENPELLEQAIQDVGRLQSLPIRYQERIPSQDWSQISYGIALGLLLILALATGLETRAWSNADA